MSAKNKWKNVRAPSPHLFTFWFLTPFVEWEFPSVCVRSPAGQQSVTFCVSSCTRLWDIQGKRERERESECISGDFDTSPPRALTHPLITPFEWHWLSSLSGATHLLYRTNGHFRCLFWTSREIPQFHRFPTDLTTIHTPLILCNNNGTISDNVSE